METLLSERFVTEKLNINNSLNVRVHACVALHIYNYLNALKTKNKKKSIKPNYTTRENITRHLDIPIFNLFNILSISFF
jgi:hypothetical protein